MRTSFLVLVCLLTHWAQPVLGKDVVRELAGGAINWSQGVVHATGYGTARPGLPKAQHRLMSRRAAIVDAQRNLLEITAGIQISSEVTTDQLMQENRETKSKIEGIIKGAQLTKDHYQNDIATVTLSMPMAGKFLQTVLPHAQAEGPSLGKMMSLPAGRLVDQAFQLLVPSAIASDSFVISNENDARTFRKLLDWMEQNPMNDVQGDLENALITFEANAMFSGLIVDASKVQEFEVATIPRIRDEIGTILYPSDETSYDDIVDKRGVTYDFDLEDGIRNKRVATTPMVLTALSTWKTLNSDLVISAEDAAALKKSESTVASMHRAGVLIVVSF